MGNIKATEATLEEIIHYLQKNNGHVKSNDIPHHSNPDIYPIWGHIQLRLIHYGLIASDAHQKGEVTLTQKGWEFESFVKEKEKSSLDRKIKEITIGNAWLPKASLFIAGLSMIATIIISISKSDKQYIPLQEMRQLMQTQEKINKSLQDYTDSLRRNSKTSKKD